MGRNSEGILSFFCDFNLTHFGEANTTQVSIISRSVVLFVIITSSFIENLLVFLVVCSPRPSLTKSQYFVVNMCIGNQLLTLLIMPFSAVTVIKEKWIFGEVWCAATGFIFTVLINSLIFTTFVITAERLYAVSYPLSYGKHVSKRRYMGVIAGTWVGSFIFALLPIVAGALSHAESLFQYHPSMYTCTLRIPASYLTYRLYLGVYICVTYILPQSFILMAYCRLFFVAHKSASNFRKKGIHIPSMSSAENSSKKDLLPQPMRRLSADNIYVSGTSLVGEDVPRCRSAMRRTASQRSQLRRSNSRHNRQTALKFPAIEPAKDSSCADTPVEEDKEEKVEERREACKGCFKCKGKKSRFNDFNRRSQAFRNRVQKFVGKREEIQAAKTALFIIGSFIICISPYFVVIIMDVLDGNDVHASTSTTRTVSIWALFALCAITPALYFYRNRHIRFLMKQMLGGSRNSQAEKSNSNY